MNIEGPCHDLPADISNDRFSAKLTEIFLLLFMGL